MIQLSWFFIIGWLAFTGIIALAIMKVNKMFFFKEIVPPKREWTEEELRIRTKEELLCAQQKVISALFQEREELTGYKAQLKEDEIFREEDINFANIEEHEASIREYLLCDPNEKNKEMIFRSHRIEVGEDQAALFRNIFYWALAMKKEEIIDLWLNVRGDSFYRGEYARHCGTIPELIFQCAIFDRTRYAYLINHYKIKGTFSVLIPRSIMLNFLKESYWPLSFMEKYFNTFVRTTYNYSGRSKFDWAMQGGDYWADRSRSNIGFAEMEYDAPKLRGNRAANELALRFEKIEFTYRLLQEDMRKRKSWDFGVTGEEYSNQFSDEDQPFIKINRSFLISHLLAQVDAAAALTVLHFAKKAKTLALLTKEALSLNASYAVSKFFHPYANHAKGAIYLSALYQAKAQLNNAASILAFAKEEEQIFFALKDPLLLQNLSMGQRSWLLYRSFSQTTSHYFAFLMYHVLDNGGGYLEDHDRLSKWKNEWLTKEHVRPLYVKREMEKGKCRGYDPSPLWHKDVLFAQFTTPYNNAEEENEKAIGVAIILYWILPELNKIELAPYLRTDSKKGFPVFNNNLEQAVMNEDRHYGKYTYENPDNYSFGYKLNEAQKESLKDAFFDERQREVLTKRFSGNVYFQEIKARPDYRKLKEMQHRVAFPVWLETELAAYIKAPHLELVQEKYRLWGSDIQKAYWTYILEDSLSYANYLDDFERQKKKQLNKTIPVVAAKDPVKEYQDEYGYLPSKYFPMESSGDRNAKTLKRAYLGLARKIHPDKHATDPEAEKNMVALGRAFAMFDTEFNGDAIDGYRYYSLVRRMQELELGVESEEKVEEKKEAAEEIIPFPIKRQHLYPKKSIRRNFNVLTSMFPGYLWSEDQGRLINHDHIDASLYTAYKENFVAYAVAYKKDAANRLREDHQRGLEDGLERLLAETKILIRSVLYQESLWLEEEKEFTAIYENEYKDNKELNYNLYFIQLYEKLKWLSTLQRQFNELGEKMRDGLAVLLLDGPGMEAVLKDKDLPLTAEQSAAFIAKLQEPMFKELLDACFALIEQSSFLVFPKDWAWHPKAMQPLKKWEDFFDALEADRLEIAATQAVANSPVIRALIQSLKHRNVPEKEFAAQIAHFENPRVAPVGARTWEDSACRVIGKCYDVFGTQEKEQNKLLFRFKEKLKEKNEVHTNVISENENTPPSPLRLGV